MKLVVIAIVLLILVFGTVLGFAQDSDEFLINQTMAAFCSAVRDKDLAELKKRYPGSNTEAWKWESERGYYSEYLIRSCVARSVEVNREKAVVSSYWERLDPRSGASITGFRLNRFITYFKKADSGWVIENHVVAENEMIDRILAATSMDVRKSIIREEKEMDTFKALDVILFRLKNDGKFELCEEYLRLAEWWGDEFCNGKDTECFTNVSATVLNARAANQVAQGNFTDAMRYYLSAEKLTEDFRSRSGKIIRGVPLTQINIGQLYLKEGNLEQAERFGRLALKSLEGFDRVDEAVNYYYLHTLLGDVFSQRGDFDSAIETYKQIHNPPPLGIGQIYLKQGKLREAEDVFRYHTEKADRALIVKESLDAFLSVEAYVGVSEIYRRRRDMEQAHLAARRAILLAKQAQDPQLIYRAHTANGKALAAKNLFAQAEVEFREAINSVEKARRTVIGGEESKISFLENRLEPYHEMIELLVARGDTQEALNFAERAKSRVLGEILQQGRTDWQSVLTGSEKEKERTLLRSLADLNREQTVLKYQKVVNKPRLEAVNREIEKARLDYEFVKSSAYANNPELSRSRGLGRPPERDEIAALIGGNSTALLNFAVTEKSIYVFVVTKDKATGLDVRAYTLEGRSRDIIDRVNDLKGRVIERNLDYRPTARTLHDILFKSTLPQIAGKTNLVIIPDAELWNVPFAALIAADGRFLVENRTLRYAQSLTALIELNKIRSASGTAQGSLFAIGNPRIDESAIARTRSQFRSELGDLPEAAAEVTEIRKLYGRDSLHLTRLDAREDVWKARAGNYRTLHLATHAITNSIAPLYSYLFLSTNPLEQSDDGLLEAWEVMNQRLKADLVVLSACETANGRIGKGEGLIGLSWAFAVANVPRVVASQWKVESKSTAELMVDFHRNLRSNTKLDVARSLQRAMVSQSRKQGRRHPFYWAAFVAIGSN